MSLGKLENEEIKIHLGLFNGGLNDTSDQLVSMERKQVPGKMNSSEARKVENVDFSKDGIIKSRAGKQKYTDELLEETPTSLFIYTRQEYS